MATSARPRRRLATAGLTLLGLFLVTTLLPRVAAAHPLGNFTINRYSRIEVGAQQIQVFYVIDMAEIPAFQEKQTIDRNGDGKIDDAERSAYLTSRLPQILANLHLSLGGAPVALSPSSSALSFAAGQGGLQTLRLAATFQTANHTDTGAAIEATYRDDNYGERIGWKEIVVRGGAGVAIQSSSVSAQDVSHELRSYPKDLLTSPLNVRSAQFSFIPSAAATSSAAVSAPAAQSHDAISRAVAVADGAFTDLISARALTLPLVLFSLLAAMLLGALHGLSPGHGKTIAGAYLVSSRATGKHALFLGLTVTATHTSSVFLLGLITLTASQFILPERLYPILNLASGLIIVTIGGILTFARGRRLLRRQLGARRRARAITGLRTAPAPRALALAGASARFAPAGATHGHTYDAGGERDHLSAPGDGRPHDHAHGPGADHDHHDGHSHDRGDGSEHGHSHLPPGADGQAITWRSLLALGISGGLLPCPSALVVLLSAISLHRLGFGLVLIVAFSIGLSATLVGIGMLLVYARHLFNRVNTEGRMMQALPVLSAITITLFGLILTATALGVRGLPAI